MTPWWNRLDGFLQKELHCIPSRADRCCYVLYQPKYTVKYHALAQSQTERPSDWLEQAVDYILDPITGSKAHNQTVLAILLIHVDDLMIAGSKSTTETLMKTVTRFFKIGSEWRNRLSFTGQKVEKKNGVVEVSQNRGFA